MCEGFGVNSNTQLVVKIQERGWSVAFVDAGTSVIIPGQTRTVQPNVLGGVLPTQSYKLNQSKTKYNIFFTLTRRKSQVQNLDLQRF
ncbi:MAG: hypothetical protein CM15mP14_3180 [Rhodospirillaceae bacterium]|nr:MAG: hypothetical protein CM15mP14_3180 [Rhodospirillaceae bacterium]